jgi:NSS family neurotransmitter:Na+ symporter
MAKQTVKRESFTSKFGVIAAAAGSAVGLGNIWRFPYVTGENGGGAFLLIYILFVIIIGVPAMMAELIIGRRAQRNAIGAFKVLKPNSPWVIVGFAGVITVYLILAFYSTVAGWTMHYTYLAIIDAFKDKSPQQLAGMFDFEPMLLFKAAAGSDVAPTVEF